MLRRGGLLALIGTVLVASAARAPSSPTQRDWCATLYDAVLSGDSEWVWTHRLGDFEIAALECDHAGLDVAAAAAAASGSYKSFVLAVWASAIVGGEDGRHAIARLEALAESLEVREHRNLPDFAHFRILVSDTDSAAVEDLKAMCLCRRSMRAEDAILRLSVIGTAEAREGLASCTGAPIEDRHDQPSREAASAALARVELPPDVVWGDGETSPRRELIAAILRVGLPNLADSRDWLMLDDKLRFRLVDRTWLAVPDPDARPLPFAPNHSAVAAPLRFEAHVRRDGGAAIVAVIVDTRGYEVVLHRRGEAWQVVMVHPTWVS